jgi:hypothetical protein
VAVKDFRFESVLEANEEDKVVEWAENNGWLVRKMQYIGRRGCPDRFFFGYGKIVMIEFKKPKKGLDELQVKEHKRLGKAGLTPFVCHSAATAIDILKGYMK